MDTNKVQEGYKVDHQTHEAPQKHQKASLSHLDWMVDVISAQLQKCNPLSSNDVLNDKAVERVNSFKAEPGSSFLNQLTDEHIESLTIETLLFLAGLAISLDLQEAHRVSEETIKFTKRLEEKRMKDLEAAYINWSMIATATSQAGMAVGTYTLSITGKVNSKQARIYSESLGQVGNTVFGNTNRQGISTAEMMKQLVSSMKQEQQTELQLLTREIEKLEQMIEKTSSLRLQAFRN